MDGRQLVTVTGGTAEDQAEAGHELELTQAGAIFPRMRSDTLGWLTFNRAAAPHQSEGPLRHAAQGQCRLRSRRRARRAAK